MNLNREGDVKRSYNFELGNVYNMVLKTGEFEEMLCLDGQRYDLPNKRIY
jgi:hypothetical protein